MWKIFVTISQIAITLFALLATPAIGKTIYKIVHADGSITYTDSPQPGAVKVSLGTLNIANTNGATAQNDGQSTTYKLTITQPADGSTVVNSNGYVTISADMQPLSEGSFQIVVDGMPVHIQSHPNFALKDVEEGLHRVQVNFIDEEGNLVASSPAQTFTLDRSLP